MTFNVTFSDVESDDDYLDDTGASESADWDGSDYYTE